MITAETVDSRSRPAVDGGGVGVEVAELRLAPAHHETDNRSAEHEAAEALVINAEEAIERHEYVEAVATLEVDRAFLAAFPELAVRGLLAESWARMSVGELDEADHLLHRARPIAESTPCDDTHVAAVAFQLGCCRFNTSRVANAVSLLTHALALASRSPRPDDRLRARILEWRSRCHQHHRDWEAARTDAARALELAESAGDARVTAHVQFQASLIAEREGQWLLARFYAEEAKGLYASVGDELGVHRALNNLGGINFLLGDMNRAVECLKEAFRIALERRDDVGAAYAMSSLAQVQLRTGEAVQAEQHARRALELLDGRIDHVNEVGNAQLVLGRALVDQSRLDEAERVFDAADLSFERLSSVSHQAAAWIARGDLAARRCDSDAAAAHYRRAAEALQDFHF